MTFLRDRIGDSLSSLNLDFNHFFLYIVHVDIVADANIFLSVLLNEPEKKHIIGLTSEVELLSPEVLPFEIGNALSAMYKRKRLDFSQCNEVLQQFLGIPVRLVKVNLENALSIALENKIYAYDAYYLDIAMRLGKPLMTLDSRMRNVAIKLGLKILEV
jgi:predicted nucleic acid-binding protein